MSWEMAGTAWKEHLGGWERIAGAWKQIKHAWECVHYPDPNNPGQMLQEWRYIQSYVPPESAPANPTFGKTNPTSVDPMEAQGWQGGWTVPAKGTPEYDYTVTIRATNETRGLVHQKTVKASVGSISVSATDLAAETGSNWLSSDSVYGEHWYTNNMGTGPLTAKIYW